MELANILAMRSVILCKEPISRGQLFELLAKAASAETGFSQEIIVEALNEREGLGSTGLGNGIAIPHGKVTGLPGVVAVFARVESPIDFEAMDDLPVDLVMMLLAPFGAGADHLKALSCVARLLRTESVVNSIRGARSAGRIHDVLTAPLEASDAA